MSRPAIVRGATQSKPFVCARCVIQIQRNGARSMHAKTAARKEREEMEWQNQAQEVRHGKRKSLLSTLEERGFIKDIAGDRTALDTLLSSRRIGAYAGIDPTAASLHLGHLLPFMILFWLYIHGHSATSLIGGATAKIGDPTGRLTSRAEEKGQIRTSNLISMHNQVRGLWMNVDKIAQKHGYVRTLAWRRALLNNSTWMNKLNIVDFLSLMGKGARMGTMLGRDTVKNKMTNGDGMSFAEFTYPLLQAWDWWHMYSTQNVQLQIGGSDQYGNIIAGMDAIKYLQTPRSDESQKAPADSLSQPFGITVPLLTTSSGVKFGKSAGNAVWLDKDMTSAFDLYGFLLRSSDADIERYLRLFTFLPIEHIAFVMTEHSADPGKRVAQHLLAREVLELVHGPNEAEKTAQAHRMLRNPTFSSITAPEKASETDGEELNKRAVTRMKLPHSLVHGTPASRILFHAGIAKTKSDGARMIKAGGVYVGAESSLVDEKGGMPDGELKFRPLSSTSQEMIDGYVRNNSMLVLRSGKWKVRVVEVLHDAQFESEGLTAPGWDEWKLARDEKMLKDVFERQKKTQEEEAVLAKEKSGKWDNDDDMWKKLRSP